MGRAGKGGKGLDLIAVPPVFGSRIRRVSGLVASAMPYQRCLRLVTIANAERISILLLFATFLLSRLPALSGPDEASLGSNVNIVCLRGT